MAHLLDNENQNTALAVKNLCPQIPLNDLVKRFPLVIFYWIANMRIALEDEFSLHRYGLTVFPVAGLIGDCAIAVCGPHGDVLQHHILWKGDDVVFFYRSRPANERRKPTGTATAPRPGTFDSASRVNFDFTQ